jgi:hypothetical protein
MGIPLGTNGELEEHNWKHVRTYCEHGKNTKTKQNSMPLVDRWMWMNSV